MYKCPAGAEACPFESKFIANVKRHADIHHPQLRAFLRNGEQPIPKKELELVKR